MSFRGIATFVVCLVAASCSTPTQPARSPGSPATQDVGLAAGQSTKSLEAIESGRSRDPQMSGAFRQDEFVISVHGVRLVPGLFVETFYDVDPECQWPLGWAGGMDFHASADGKLWDSRNVGEFTTRYRALAEIKDHGNGFTHTVQLSAMDNPKQITFAIVLWNPDGYFFRAFGRADCRRCTEVDASR